MNRNGHPRRRSKGNVQGRNQTEEALTLGTDEHPRIQIRAGRIHLGESIGRVITGQLAAELGRAVCLLATARDDGGSGRQDEPDGDDAASLAKC